MSKQNQVNTTTFSLFPNNQILFVEIGNDEAPINIEGGSIAKNGKIFLCLYFLESSEKRSVLRHEKTRNHDGYGFFGFA
jgi:hypothetical protein